MQPKHIRFFSLFVLLFIALVGNKSIAQPLTAVTPKADATLASSPTLFQWNSKDNAINYKFELASDSLFTSIIHQTTTTDLQAANPITLAPNNYFWRVIALYLSSPNDTSLFYKFNIFNPSQLSGLKLWLKADSVELTNNKVSKWPDLSGNNNHVTQTDTNFQPTKALNQLNENPTIQFDGINDILDGEDILDIDTSNQSVFLMGKSINNTGSFYAKSIAQNFPNRFGLVADNSTLVSFYHDNQLRLISTSFLPYQNKFCILNQSLNRTTDLSKLYINGILIGSSPINHNFNYQSDYNFVIGAYNNSLGTINPAVFYLNGDISEIIIYNTPISDTQRLLVQNYLQTKYAPPVNLGYDIKSSYGFCYNTINAGSGYLHYQWNTGDTTEQISINKSGKYWVHVTNIFGFQSSDTVMVNYSSVPSLFSDTTICLGDTAKINLNIGSPYIYNWSNGQTSTNFTSTTSGIFHLQITDTLGCSYRDTLSVLIDSLPIKLWLGSDTSICLSNSIGYQLLNYTPIDGLSGGFTYLWNTGDTTATTLTTSSGNYSLILKNLRGCTAKDTVNVTLQGIPPSTNFILSADSICTGDTLHFTDLTPGPVSDRNWTIGEGAPITDSTFYHIYNNPGTYSIELTTLAGNGCPKTAVKTIKVNPAPTANFATSPPCTGLSTLFANQSTAALGDSIVSQLWNFDDIASGSNNTSTLQNPDHQFSNPGMFNPQLSITTLKGCSITAIHTLDVASSATSPSPFTLVSPQNNQLIPDSTITFKWNSSGNAYFYSIQIASDINFSNFIFQKSGLTANQYTYRFSQFGTFYWRIVAQNICGNESISNVQKIELFSPSQIPGLQAWFNPARGITSINNKIIQWIESSENSHSVIQSDTSFSPQLISNALNSYPLIRLDGIDDYLDGGNILNIENNSNTFFVMGKCASSSGTFICKSIPQNINNRWFILKEAGSLLFGSDNSTVSNSILSTSVNNNYNIITANRNRISLNNELYLNGILKESKSVPTSNLNNSYDLLIGAYNNISGSTPPSGGYFLNGDIGEIILYNNTITEAQRQKVETYLSNKYAPPVNLGYDIKISYKLCDTVISAQANHFTNYLWSTGDTTPSIQVNRSGSYWVRATNIFGQTSSDTVRIDFLGKRTIPDTTVCLGNSFEYNWTPLANYTLNWSNGNSGSTFTETEAGSYHFTLTDTLGCTYKDTFNLYVDSLAMRMSLGEDISLCSGNTLTYTLNNYTLTSPEYLWNTGNTTPNIVVSAPGAYWLQITNSRGCIARDTVMVGIRGEAPVVAFTAPGKCMGETTPFTDQSYTTDGSNVVSWQWNFGDGNNSTSQNPTHNYALPGIYPITLTLTTDSVCSNSITIPTVVYSLPSANFSPITGCNNTPIQFTDQSITHDGYTLQNWQWNFGDLQSGVNNTSTSQHPVHPFDTAGVYSIKIKVESNVGCTDSIQKEVYIKPSPIANFTASNTCEGETTWFSDSSITESWNTIVGRSWEFADGSTSTQPTLSKKYPSAGAYSVNYIIQSINGCIDTITKDAIVHTIPVANFVTNSFCANQPVFLESSSTIANDSITSVRWKINNNLVFAQSPVEFLLPNAGTYNVELVVSTPYQCSDTIQKSITIKPIPTAQFSFGYDANSIGYNIQFNNQSQEANSYAWYSNSNLISTLYSPNYNFQMQGEYPIMMIAQNSQQCTDTAFAMLTMIRPFIDLAISNLDIHNTGNYLQASANLINMSNRDITDLWLTLQINEQQIRERWTGMLHAGESIPFNFRTQLYLATGEELQYGCVEIATPIGYPEDNMDNNQICITKKQAFSILKVFPNPANEEINLWLTSPIESEATIRILSTKGSQVKTWNKQILQKGINQLKLPLIELSNGLYILEIEFNNKIERMKFNVIR